MLNYLLEVTLCWGVFYLIYALLLSRQTFFVVNRWYLISTLTLGLLIPLLEWQQPVSIEQHPIVNTIEPLQITVQQFEQKIIVAQQQNYFNWWNILLALYWIGVGVCTLRFGHGLWKIWQTYRSSEVVQNGNYRIVYTNSSHLPYSFFNCLFWSRQFEAELSEQQQILRHEEAHINEWHTLDVLWMEVLGILFWCSPMIYLYRASMRNVHEYLADAWVIQTTNKRTYGRLLLSQSLSGFQIALANHFINSQLKKRIIMMTRHESPRHALLRYMWLLPIVMLTFLIFSKKENREVLKAQVAIAPTIINMDFSTLPIPEGTDFKMTAGFGMRMHPIHKVKKMHKGVDFRADLGSPVIATEDGRILMTKADKEAYGNHIIIEHSNGFRTMYAHLQDIKAQVGQSVKRGEVIGTVGATGYATMPHLHYEIIKDGKKLDPMEYIKSD